MHVFSANFRQAGAQQGGGGSPALDEISFIFVGFALIFRVISLPLGILPSIMGQAPLPLEIPSCAPAVKVYFLDLTLPLTKGRTFTVLYSKGMSFWSGNSHYGCLFQRVTPIKGIIFTSDSHWVCFFNELPLRVSFLPFHSH